MNPQRNLFGGIHLLGLIGEVIVVSKNIKMIGIVITIISIIIISIVLKQYLDNEMDLKAVVKDYPLIEYYFLENSDWSVIISYLPYETDRIEMICDEEELLETIKERFYITTFPAGRGTTGNGLISVYKNGELLKAIEFVEIKIEKYNIRSVFQEFEIG